LELLHPLLRLSDGTPSLAEFRRCRREFDRRGFYRCHRGLRRCHRGLRRCHRGFRRCHRRLRRYHHGLRRCHRGLFRRGFRHDGIPSLIEFAQSSAKWARPLPATVLWRLVIESESTDTPPLIRNMPQTAPAKKMPARQNHRPHQNRCEFKQADGTLVILTKTDRHGADRTIGADSTSTCMPAAWRVRCVASVSLVVGGVEDRAIEPPVRLQRCGSRQPVFKLLV
jgi:hypothetical protein